MIDINESLNIDKKNNEISNRKTDASRKSRIMLNDLLKISIEELVSKIEGLGKKKEPITGIVEAYEIEEVKKFLDINNSLKEIKLLSYNNGIPHSNKDMINYNNREMKNIISSINNIIKKYYGRLFIKTNGSSDICDIYLELTISKDKYLIKNEEFIIAEDKFIITENYLANELELMTLEENEVIEEFMLSEGEAELDKKYEIPSKNKKNLVNDENSDKKDSEVKGVKKLIKAIYGMSDEDFVNGAFAPIFGKALARGVALITISAGAGLIKYKKSQKHTKESKFDTVNKINKTKNIASAGLVSSLVLVIGFITNKALKSSMRAAQREKLSYYYGNKIKYINDKLERAETPEEKLELNKIKSKLIKDKEKIQIFSTKEKSDE